MHIFFPIIFFEYSYYNFFSIKFDLYLACGFHVFFKNLIYLDIIYIYIIYNLFHLAS